MRALVLVTLAGFGPKVRGVHPGGLLAALQRLTGLVSSVSSHVLFY